MLAKTNRLRSGVLAGVTAASSRGACGKAGVVRKMTVADIAMIKVIAMKVSCVFFS